MDLSALTGLYQWVPAFLLVLARVGGLFVTAPVLGDHYLPVTVKGLLSTAIALVLLPHTVPAPVPADGHFLLALVREVLVGLTLGFVIDLVFQGVRMGGELINRHAGFTAAENFDPDSDIGQGPMGDLMYLLVVLLFLATDGHLVLIATIAQSYHVVPLGEGAFGAASIGVVTQAVADSWVTAMNLSFPILTAVMMITVVEGVITRAVPQINLLQLTFAVKIVLSIGVLYAALPAAVAFLGTLLSGIPLLAGALLGTMR